MKEKLQILLDRAYEFVGLIELSISRDEASPELLESLGHKAAEMLEEAELLRCYPEDPEPQLYDEVPDSECPEPPLYDVDSDNAETHPASETHNAHTAEVQVEREDRAAEIVTPKQKKRIRGRMTLNDRFLFTRELFGGDRTALDQAVEMLASMDSEEVAAFVASKGWDPDNSEVKHFVEINGHHIVDHN